MHDDEAHNCRHAQEVNNSNGLEIIKQARELGELHRLPEAQAGNHDENADEDYAEIKNFLDRVVNRQIVMAETEVQRIVDRGEKLAERYGKQLFSESPGDDAVSQVGNAVEHENPHSKEMPLQAVLRPYANHDGVGKMQPAENYIVVIDLPAAADHDENGDRIDPMHDAQR